MFDYDQILPELTVGSCPAHPRDARWLGKRLGISAVLNLQTDADIVRLELNMDKLESAYEKYGVELHRLPIVDLDPHDLHTHLDDAVVALDELLERHARVYVRCTLGLQRSPSVCIAWLSWSRSMSLSVAWNHVRERRECLPEFDALWRANRERRDA